MTVSLVHVPEATGEVAETPMRNPFPGERWQAGRPFDLRHYRRVFPDRWAAFLRAQFWSVEHVAIFFDVTGRTAQNWWDGIGGVPGGHFTTAAAQAFPASFAHHCKVA